MASGLIHICITKEINKYLKRNENEILIGSIAPDIAKLINIPKEKTHFIDTEKDIPNIEKFLEKYKKNLNNDFVMGYYIHLYTDYLWFKYFIPSFIEKNKIIKLDNNKENFNEEKLIKYIYSDYETLTKEFIEKFNIDFKIFYQEPPKIENIITEMPIDKLNIIIDKAGLMIKNSKESKEMIFDKKLVTTFIEFCVNDIIANIDNLNK